MRERKYCIEFLLSTFLFFSLSGTSLADQAVKRSHTEYVPLSVSHPDPLPHQVIEAGHKSELHGKVEHNEARQLAAVNAGLGMKLVPEGKSLFPARVTQVLPGSLVGKRGLAISDRLISEIFSDGTITLTIEHNGQGMRFSIKASELPDRDAIANIDRLSQLNPSLARSAVGSRMPAGDVNDSDRKEDASGGTARNDTSARTYQSIKDVFENHDLVMIIDRSGSMAAKDCPNKMSRWDWCCQQARDLAQAAAQASSAVTTVFFNDEYNVFEGLNPNDIPARFAEYQPRGDTFLNDPLAEQLNHYFQTRTKPLIIVIVTDGMPDDCPAIADSIKEASNQLRYAGEITITFLLIGHQVDETGLRARVGEHMDGSIKNGGMVDVIPFDTLLAKGVKKAFSEELKEVRLATNRSKPSQAGKFAEGATMDLLVRLNNPRHLRSQNGSYSSADPAQRQLESVSRERSDLERALLKKYR